MEVDDNDYSRKLKRRGAPELESDLGLSSFMDVHHGLPTPPDSYTRHWMYDLCDVSPRLTVRSIICQPCYCEVPRPFRYASKSGCRRASLAFSALKFIKDIEWWGAR